VNTSLVRIALLILSGAALSATAIVPGGWASTDADSNGISPLSVGSNFFSPNITGRFQQIYAANQFAGIGAGEAITAIAFRPDVIVSRFASMSVLGDIRVSLTTTNIAVNGLSTNYASNLNSTTTEVYSGEITFTRPFDDGTPRGFHYIINLETPYFFDPLAGNLLLDIIVVTGNDPLTSTLPTLDYSRADSTASVVLHFSSSVSGWQDASGIEGESQGFPTQFTFSVPASGVPEPGTLSLLGAGLGMCVWRARRR
jgi:hypothetical protein